MPANNNFILKNISSKENMFNKQKKYCNNFDLLRLLAASFVFISHSFNIYGKHDFEFISLDGFRPITFGTLGVGIFFVISGFLITKSFISTVKREHFIIKRLLRLYPAVFLNILLVYCVIAPLTTTVDISEYFGMIYKNAVFLLANGVFFQFPNLHWIFTANPNSDFKGFSVVNLPLWTLFYELTCYMIVLICGVIFNARITIPLITLIYISYNCDIIFFPRTVSDLAVIYCAFFFLGACLFLYKKYVPINGKMAVICLTCMVGLSTVNLYVFPLYLLLVAYIIMYVALQAKYLGDFAKYGDFSYGLYIYAWPVQQTVAIMFDLKDEMFPIYMIVSFVVALIFAVFSWHVIERPAIMLKHKLR
jgi:peptidoglycan/LPS O-acetylase OafA/YrhL